MADTTEKLLNLTPDQILISDNIRFGLKPYRLERLKEEIQRDGRINTPIEVQPLDKETGKYLLTAGEYRVTAVSELNKMGAGMTIPARIIPVENALQRKLRQISENSERENLSPIERAMAMRQLEALGASKMDIRKTFAAPGGRKGLKVQPASNSHINNSLAMLDFPKDIQRKIHDGLIGSAAAYELSKLPKDKWQDVLDRIEAERIKTLDREDKEEETLLKTMREAEEQQAEAAKAAAELTAVQTAAEATAAALVASKKALTDAFTATQAAKVKEEKDAAEKAFKEAKAAAKEAETANSQAAKDLAKLEDKRKALAEKAEAARKRIEDARAAKGAKAPAPEAKVSQSAVRKAAKAEGVAPKLVALNSGEKTEAIKTLVYSGKPKTKVIGEAILACFEGKLTDGQMLMAVSKVLEEESTGRPVAPPKKK
jgi:hypothetical protein